MKITAITPFPPSHVAGIIAGDGTLSGGHIQGIAPQAFIVSVRVLDAHGKRKAVCYAGRHSLA